jgi:hypothetical protein
MFIETITRAYLMTRLASLPPHARGRREIERLLKDLTNAELARKPRVRVKAESRRAVNMALAGKVR